MTGQNPTLFHHRHPYPVHIPEGTVRILVGTLPPPRFSLGELRPRDVDFCYGSCDGLLWPVLAAIYHLTLRYDNSREAVSQRKAFLLRERTGICDIVEACVRDRIDSSDLGMREVVLRDILAQLSLHPTIHTIIFTGGNSRNGPEYLFRRHLLPRGISLRCVDDRPPRKHRFSFAGREITTISLTSPSRAANRAIGSSEVFRLRRLEHPVFTPFDYRVEQYTEVFLGPTVR